MTGCTSHPTLKQCIRWFTSHRHNQWTSWQIMHTTTHKMIRTEAEKHFQTWGQILYRISSIKFIWFCMKTQKIHKFTVSVYNPSGSGRDWDIWQCSQEWGQDNRAWFQERGGSRKRRLDENRQYHISYFSLCFTWFVLKCTLTFISYITGYCSLRQWAAGKHTKLYRTWGMWSETIWSEYSE